MKPILYMSLRSPFARRVRLTLEELGADYATETIDVFNPPPGYLEINPLGRVPVYRTETGQVIIDSWAILEHLRASNGSHPLFLTGGTDGAEGRSLSGLAVGVMEHVVAAYLEKLRGPSSSPAAYDEAVENAARGLSRLERRVASMTTPYLMGDSLRACDLDVGAAVGYALLRFPETVAPCKWLKGYHERLLSRPSFRKTVPPA